MQLRALTYNDYKDGGFNFFLPLLERCLVHEGSGDIEDPSTMFIAVVLPPSEEQNPNIAYIVTTKLAFDKKSIEIQNYESLLKSKHNFVSVDVVFTHPKEIHAILQDAKSASKDDKQKEKNGPNKDSTAQRDLEHIVREAVLSGTSDIHFYTYADRAEAVFKIDGKFQQSIPLGREQAMNIVAASLNTKSPDYKSVVDDEEIADVSVHLNINLPDPADNDKEISELINLRTSKSGAMYGPHTVMRVIRTSKNAVKTIDTLGMDKDTQEMLLDVTNSAHGIVIITGPTGSGKSTTLAALYESIPEDRKIILLEDPVEYLVSRKNCVQKAVMPSVKGLNFIDYLKNALRQDPDIIGISEMRSKEVMDIVVKAALTGHLMISTLHTNDAIGAITRLIDEGVNPKILAESTLLRAIAAQRLVPKLCQHCRVETVVPSFEKAFTQSPSGCNHCGYQGTKGRVLISELIVFDSKGREFIANRDLGGLLKHIKSNGWKGMVERARFRVEQGLIDPFYARTAIGNIFNVEGGDDFSYKDPEFCEVK